MKKTNKQIHVLFKKDNKKFHKYFKDKNRKSIKKSFPRSYCLKSVN